MAGQANGPWSSPRPLSFQRVCSHSRRAPARCGQRSDGRGDPRIRSEDGTDGKKSGGSNAVRESESGDNNPCNGLPSGYDPVMM